MRLIWIIITLVLFSIFGISESFAEESNWDTSDFIIQGGTLIEIKDDPMMSSIILHVEMDMDGYVVVPKINYLSARPDCTPTDSIFVIIDDKVEAELDIDKNDHNLSIKTPKDSKKIEIIVFVLLPLHTTSLVYAKFCKALDDGKITSPRAQTRMGFLVNDIICKEDRDLIFNLITNKPVCVKPDNVAKLSERGYSTKSSHPLPFSNMHKLDDDDANNSIIRYYLHDATLENIDVDDQIVRFNISNPGNTAMLSVLIPRGILLEDSVNLSDLDRQTCRNHAYTYSFTPTHLKYVIIIPTDANQIKFVCNV